MPGSDRKNTSVERIKTGSFERRLSLTKAGLTAGSRLASSMALNLFSGKAKREQRRRDALSREARYLVEQLGQLKGSVVKIGQVMALYGEHFLPIEVTEALHTLEDRTTALGWSIIGPTLEKELGSERFQELDIEQEPIGAASLGQVHRAIIRRTGEQICLKVQYPGVADAIDSDIEAVATLLKLTRMVRVGPDFEAWLDEVRHMMHREVDYKLELETTRRFGEMLEGDSRFIVPGVYPEYSNGRVMATSYEKGVSISDRSVLGLPQAARNRLAIAALELFLHELFDWAELQTDPNFGNYRVRIEGGQVRLVLLDFGAVQAYPEAFIQPVCGMIRAAYEQDRKTMIHHAVQLHFMRYEWPQTVLDEFADVCIAVLEPLTEHVAEIAPPHALNPEGQYRWKYSDLPTRIARRAARSAFNRYFQIPPKEFVFLNRKLVGVYTFISVLDAEFNGAPILKPFLYRDSGAPGGQPAS